MTGIDRSWMALHLQVALEEQGVKLGTGCGKINLGKVVDAAVLAAQTDASAGESTRAWYDGLMEGERHSEEMEFWRSTGKQGLIPQRRPNPYFR